jgi:hypothetical protein
MAWPAGTVLNASGRPRDLWRKWPSCCQRVYYASLMNGLLKNPHAPAPPAICAVHGDVRKRPDAP